MPNLFNAGTFKLTDRRDILERVYTRLYESPDCYIPVRGMFPNIGEDCDSNANWESREVIARLIREYIKPETPNTNPEVLPDDIAVDIEGEYNGN